VTARNWLKGMVVFDLQCQGSRRQPLAEGRPVRNWRIDFDHGPCNAGGRAGLFGMAPGIMVPIATLVLHLIYGEVLGGTYGVEHPDPPPQFQATHRF
jgi:hypothetical protein